MGIFPKILLNLNYVFPLNLFNLQKSINKILLYASKDIREDDAPNYFQNLVRRWKEEYFIYGFLEKILATVTAIIYKNYAVPNITDISTMEVVNTILVKEIEKLANLIFVSIIR